MHCSDYFSPSLSTSFYVSQTEILDLNRDDWIEEVKVTCIYLVLQYKSKSLQLTFSPPFNSPWIWFAIVILFLVFFYIPQQTWFYSCRLVDFIIVCSDGLSLYIYVSICFEYLSLFKITSSYKYARRNYLKFITANRKFKWFPMYMERGWNIKW